MVWSPLVFLLAFFAPGAWVCGWVFFGYLELTYPGLLGLPSWEAWLLVGVAYIINIVALSYIYNEKPSPLRHPTVNVVVGSLLLAIAAITLIISFFVKEDVMKTWRLISGGILLMDSWNSLGCAGWFILD